MWRRARLSLLGGCCATAATAFIPGRAHCRTLDLDDTSVRNLRASISTAIQQTKPPVARREPHTVYFGVNPEDRSENRGVNPMDPPVEYVDDLFWIRDDDRKNEEMLSLLNAENAYTDMRTAHLEPFREVLYAEMLSHIQEDDDEYPVPVADGYEYWGRTVKGQSFKQYLRRKIGAAVDAVQVYLDVNAVPSLPFFTSNDAWDAKQCDVQSIKPSPSGGMLAYCVDGSGYA
jgi:oligopeptidase B